ncbi:hypothetical protein EVAR_43851_1 [Eumeta japonica]|uniref:Uncharacterized protein n=1 Tax=Eumeta variegata TaxID=151549 RepID=A0A4C1X192_EUMVA|nr:hypothetical protein EVAR_43851_1 [Eumeta japonica]
MSLVRGILYESSSSDNGIDENLPDLRKTRVYHPRVDRLEKLYENSAWESLGAGEVELRNVEMKIERGRNCDAKRKAMEHPAFASAGQRAGVEIWRIEVSFVRSSAERGHVSGGTISTRAAVKVPFLVVFRVSGERRAVKRHEGPVAFEHCPTGDQSQSGYNVVSEYEWDTGGPGRGRQFRWGAIMLIRLKKEAGFTNRPASGARSSVDYSLDFKCAHAFFKHVD